MLESYRQHVAEREAEGLPPLPLNAEQVAQLIELIKNPPAGEEEFLMELLVHRVPPGVDQAAYVKAAFLADVAKGNTSVDLIDPVRATEILGTMLGGYNIQPLIDLLDNDTTADAAAQALSHTLLIYDAFHDVADKAKDNEAAAKVVKSWADAEWFTSKPPLAEEITVTVFKVPGETNTDDLSPATEAWSRPDIPLHAKSMLVNKMDDPLGTIEKLKEKGHPIAYVGDVVGTGSSRKSAINSVLWHMGEDIPYVPNKREGGVILGGKIAPIFFNTAEDSGALPIECDVSAMETGDVIRIRPYDGLILNEAGEEICKFCLSPATMADEVRANGRIPLIIGRGLTDRAREFLDMGPSDIFLKPQTGV
ncbi:MAG TPA: aconitate hydratase B, partial [Gammaproteobacteria bacterium]|nr:aconitate hydratase B [Gammaproteobacteria bacterium]